MVRSLFEICSSSVRNAVIDGHMLTVANLPSTLRRWMFEFFRTEQLLNDKNVIQFFDQSGFFDGFTTIHTYETCTQTEYAGMSYDFDKSNGCFLVFLVTTLSVDRRLAENLTDLTVDVSGSGVCNCDRRHAHPQTEHVGNLLGFCINLKKLHLVARGISNIACLPDLHTFSETTDVSFPALEHLTLTNYNFDRKPRQLPKRLFASLQTLRLHRVQCQSDIYRDILACCQETLVYLSVEENFGSGHVVSPVPIRLPRLRSLSYQTYSGVRIQFEDIIQNSPNLITASLELDIHHISETGLVALAKLVKSLQLHLRISDVVTKEAKIIATVRESVVALTIGDEERSSPVGDWILSEMPNVKRLECVISGQRSVEFENFLADKRRAANLTELRLSDCCLSPEALESLFTNCYNLRCLSLEDQCEARDISNYMQTWMENGARPASIYMLGVGYLLPETAYSLMKASGRNLREMVLEVRVTDEKLPQKCLDALRDHCPFVQICTIHRPIFSTISSYVPRSVSRRYTFRLKGSTVRLEGHEEFDRRW